MRAVLLRAVEAARGAIPTGTFVLYIALCVLRAPKVFDGRFRAEEGVYYGLFQHGPLLKNLLLTGPGYPVVLTNAAVLAAHLVPVEYAPFVTTAVAFAVQLVLIAMLAFWHERIGLTAAAAALIALALAVTPHSAELYASTSKTQWIAAAICVVVLIEQDQSAARLTCIVLFLCGLTGIAAALLIPAFLLKWLMDRSRVSLAQLVALAVPNLAIFAIGRALMDPVAGRTYSLDPQLYLATISVHTISDFLGYGAALWVGDWYTHSAGTLVALLASVVSAGVVAGLFAYGIACPETRRAAILLCVAYWLSVIVGVFGAFPGLLKQPYLRYMFVPNTALLLLLGLFASKLKSRVALAALAWVVVVNVWPHPALESRFFDGPSWRAQIPAGGIKEPTTVIIWPPSWKVILTPPAP